MKKIFLTSATGYIGAAVARFLKMKGYNLAALSRSDQSAMKLAQQGINTIRGDLRMPKTYLKMVLDSDVVVHTAYTDDAESGMVDKIAVEAMLNTLQGTNKTFVYTSGTWVLGNTGSSPANEEMPTDPVSFLSWQPDLERTVLEAKHKAVRTIVIRVAIVYGHNGGMIAQLLNSAINEGKLRYVGTGENYWSLIHIDDLAELYALAIQKAPSGSLFHASDGTPTRLKDIAKLVAQTAGIPNLIKSWPIEEARKELGIYADARVLNQVIDSSKAKHLLGWKPKAPTLVEELARSAKYRC